MAKKPKQNQAIHDAGPGKNRFFQSKVLWSLALVLILILSSIYFINRPAPRSVTSESPAMVQQTPSGSFSIPDVLQRTVQRTYAIDVLFHKVYNAEWEGAYGAIGDAHLYAATGDQTLLSLYTDTFRLLDMNNGTWVDDRAWVCLAELTWWKFSGRKNNKWIENAKARYLEARNEGRLSHHEGYWSWYNYTPGTKGNFKIFSNSNMNQMAAVACGLYDATHDRQFYHDALLVWNGDANYPGLVKKFYRGNGIWKGDEGKAAFGKQFPWDGAGMCAIGAAMFRMTGEKKYKEIVVATARRIMNPANGWVDREDFYQIRMDGNGAFVHFILDAYQIAPDQLPDIPRKIEKMLDHVWTNHHGTALTTLHRPVDNGIRNGWNPSGGEDGYNVNEVGTVHAQGEAVRAFGVFAYVLYEMNQQERPK